MLEIGKRYERGEGVPQNSSEAGRWLGEAAGTRSGKDQCSVYCLEEPTRSTKPPAKPPGNPRCPRPLRIVMLDDEPLVLDAVKLMLGFDLPNSFFLTFTDAESALQELEWKAPDLFTTDWNHAKMRCDEMLQVLAAKRVKYPVFVISVYAQEKDVLPYKGPDLQVAFLAKPFLLEDLRRLLSLHLSLDYPELRNMGV